jgi:hypothetical protein
MHLHSIYILNFYFDDGEQTGTRSPRLRIKWVGKDGPWRELPTPMFTNNIRFALKGYDLLKTHELPDNLDMGQLTRWDVSDEIADLPSLAHIGNLRSFHQAMVLNCSDSTIALNRVRGQCEVFYMDRL